MSKEFDRDRRRATRRGAKVVCTVASAPEDVLAALERLFVLHEARWKARGCEIPRFSTSERHRGWYRRVIGAMAQQGLVRVAEVFENDEIFASEMGLVAGRGGTAHTTAVRLGGRLAEPGHASQLLILRALEEAGARVVDLGLGAGEAGGPKASVGPTRVVVESFLAAGSPRSQKLLEVAFATRAWARRGRGRRRPEG
jgi:CelD/BcsL family acetyltransferase involved in cellulose biosynthesis